MSDRVVWVSGHDGTWGRSTDGGAHWDTHVLEAADTLQFRDIDAFDEHTAFMMSAGPGTLSRIYRTDDAGATWTLQFVMDDEDGFLDCMAFWDPGRGLAYGDAVDGSLFILRTEDGRTWRRVRGEGVPAALPGEGGFAASGSCVATAPEGRAWIATGNGTRARVVRTDDHGATWRVADVPVVDGPSSGLTTVGFVGERGFALGGVIGNDSVRTDNVAWSDDGGASWHRAGRLAKAGPAYGAAYVDGRRLLAVGPRGADWSDDGGRTWARLDTATYWAAGFADRVGWIVGPEGRITRFRPLEGRNTDPAPPVSPKEQTTPVSRPPWPRS